MKNTNQTKHYQIELQSKIYGYVEMQISANDLQDADRWARNKARMMSRNGDIVNVRNCVELRGITR